ncbi:MAG: hypothetical protein AB7F22_24630, partial [Reyranella sp.]
HGGGGNDILFGENGADTLAGDADSGQAARVVTTETTTHSAFNFTSPAGPVPEDGSIADGDGGYKTIAQVWTYKDDEGSLHKEGLYAVGGDGTYEGGAHAVQVFSFDPPDLPQTGALNDVDIYFYYYTSYASAPELIGHHVVAENEQVFVSLDISEHPEGGHLVAFNGMPSAAALADPEHNWVKQQATPSLNDLLTTETSTEEVVTYQFQVAGDQLIGGNGPDTFIYNVADSNSVDLIWDFNQSSDLFDATEGDQLVIQGAASIPVVMDGVDLGGGNTGLMLYFSDNHAIGLVGVAWEQVENSVFLS